MTEQHENLKDDADVVSLTPFLQTVWSYRMAILGGLVVVAIGFVGWALIAYARAQSDRIASLPFQLTFEGAAQDLYPNGSRFSTAEIVSTSVLAEVFKANEFERYSSLADLKNSMFVLQTNRDLELMGYEYEARLADPKLTIVERARVENEFKDKSAALKSASYTLTMRRTEGMTKVPTALMSKILYDTLATWAEQAAERKGAVRYDIPVLSKAVLRKEFFAAEDFIIAVDILRAKYDRLLKSLDLIEALPGAMAVRMDPDHISLADLRANLEDDLRFKLEPLINTIRANGLSRNPVRMRQYFEGRQLEVRLAQAEISERVKALQEALRGYELPRGSESQAQGDSRAAEVTPQLSESFIDRLVQLSTRAADVGYRQEITRRIIEDGITLTELGTQANYYDQMRRSFVSTTPNSNPRDEADVARRTGQVFDDLGKAMDQVQSIYQLIAQQNLSPDLMLYQPTGGFTVRTATALSLRSTMQYFLLTMFAALIALPLLCLAHHYFRDKISPSRASAAVTPPATAGPSTHIDRG